MCIYSKKVLEEEGVFWKSITKLDNNDIENQLKNSKILKSCFLFKCYFHKNQQKMIEVYGVYVKYLNFRLNLDSSKILRRSS